jgi:hypothetical protein
VGLIGNVVTGAVALLGVLLGGYLSIRNQDRLWARDHARQWRDIRLSAYTELATAFREYVAFALEPTANITAVPHPRRAGELMPFFDEAGRPYKERLEAAFTAARLVAERPETVRLGSDLVTAARQVAAARAAHSEADLPPDVFQKLWCAQHELLIAVRQELGLPPFPPRSVDA